MRRRWVAWLLLVAGIAMVLVGVASGFRGLTNLDGEPCPAVFGEDRLVTVLTGEDPACDATREAQRTLVYTFLGTGVASAVGAVLVFGIRFGRRATVRARVP
jgi:hypothetical protein